MSYQVEVAPDFVRPPQVIDETTPGAIPASGTMLEVGKVSTFNITHDVTNRKFRVIGNEDLIDAVKTGEAYAIQVECSIFESAFLKRLVSARGGGAGTIDKNFSMVWSHKINNSEKFELATMCRINSGSIDVTPDDVKVSYTIIADNISAPGADPTGAVTFMTPATTDPWTGLDSGANPFTHDGVTYDVPSFRCDIARNLALVRVNGKALIIGNPSTRREISGTVDIVRKDSVPRADVKAGSKVAGSYVLKSAVSTMSFTDMMLEQLNEGYSGDGSDAVIDSFGFSAKGVSVT